jgi:hypothetical protein
MAVRTISNAGGNFNSTATWVEGVVPGTGDHIVATATSGQLTVNVNSSIQYADLSLYTNTLTVNAILTLNLASATTTFGASMNFAGTASITCAVAHTFVQNTTNEIRLLTLGAGTKTFSTDIYVVNWTATGGAAYNGNTLFISGNANSGIQNISGTAILRLVGTGTFSIGQVLNVVIDTAGTLTGLPIGLGLSNLGSATWISGTIVTGRIKPVGPNMTLNLGTSQWESFDSVITPYTVTLDSDFNVDNFTHNSTSATVTGTIAGTGALKATTISLHSSTNNATGVIQYRPPRIRFSTTPTHVIGKIVANGFAGISSIATSSAQYGLIDSTTSGVQATINLTGSTFDSSVSFMDITDINVTGNQLFANQGTLTNTTNVTNTAPTGGGGGEHSYTFVN